MAFQMRILLPLISIFFWIFPVMAGESLLYEAQVIQVITKDSTDLELGYPSTVFYDRGAAELYVVHSGKGSRVAIFGGADYFPTLTLGEGRGLTKCSGVYVSPEGVLYAAQDKAAEGELPRISVFDGAFFKIREMALTGFPNAADFVPKKMVEGARGRLLVSGHNYPGALVLDRDGRFLHLIDPADTVRGGRQKADIISIDTDQNGRIYLLSEGMGRVYVYDREERFLFRFGEKGGSSGKLARARGIAVDDRAGRIYVVDYLRHGVNVYDLEGKYIFEFGGQGNGRGWFSFPSDVCVDGQGNVVIADMFNKRIQVFDIVQR